MSLMVPLSAPTGYLSLFQNRCTDLLALPGGGTSQVKGAVVERKGKQLEVRAEMNQPRYERKQTESLSVVVLALAISIRP